MSIGERIKYLRIKNHMTQSELSKKLYTSADTISLWERNKSLPDAKFIINLSNIFQVTTDYLLGVTKTQK